MKFTQTLLDYDGFVEKFKPKKTTDDCYTPPEIYETVRDWACAEYGFEPERIVRPFYPGGDYERFDYPDGCVVLDNPPFSIIRRITDFYTRNKVGFFLFAPHLTLFSKSEAGFNYVATGTGIVYENGASIPTSFVTSFGDDFIRTAPDLRERLEAANERTAKKSKRSQPKYVYPSELLTASQLSCLSKAGIDFRAKREQCYEVSQLDSQKASGKSVFGGGFLISEKLAKEKLAKEKLAKEKLAKETVFEFELSPREKRIVNDLESQGEEE